MIGYLTPAQFVLLCVFVFALFGLVVYLIADWFPVKQKPETLRQQVARVNEVPVEHDYSYLDLDDTTPESISQYIERHQKQKPATRLETRDGRVIGATRCATPTHGRLSALTENGNGNIEHRTRLEATPRQLR